MRRFQKRPDVTFAVIPGVGRLNAGRILEGDQYAKFVPSLLVEVPEAPSAPVVTEPAPAPRPTAPNPPFVIIPPPPPPAKDELADTVETPIHVPPEAIPPKPPPAASMADAGFVTPEELVAVVEQENKQTDAQIDRAVERLAPVDEHHEHKEAAKKKEAPKPTKPQPKKPTGRR